MNQRNLPHRRQSREPANRADRQIGRRGMITAVGSSLVSSVAGCLKGPSFPDADVLAGPEGRFVFEPASLTISAGETVVWGFASSGHNICCRPEDNSEVEIPANADPFATYGRDESPMQSLVPQGESYEHTFDVEGRYVYVCLPHVSQGMIGEIRVT